MNRGLAPSTLLGVLLAVTAWPVLAASADSPAGGRAIDGKDAPPKDIKPLEDERTKRFMQFGKLPNRMKNDGAPKVGEAAPPLKLKVLDGKKEVDLASFAAKKPVILFFGSYT